MIEKIIAGAIRHRVLVLLTTLAISAAGLIVLTRMPVDALPDLSDVQVIVYTDVPGQTPQVVEDQVTYPLTTAMLSIPGAQAVRGYSYFGTSFVYIIFEDGTDLYWARSRTFEQLAMAASRLPEGITPVLGPDATGVGWVYAYVLDGGQQHDLQQLRSLQDWFLRYELASVPGVAEVASIGGFVKQYQVEVDPNKLVAFNIPLSTVRQALERSNRDTGARLIEIGETEFMVRGRGYIRSIRDLEMVPVGADQHGTPILIQNVARVQIGPELRRGLADWNGEGETVGGIVVMQHGANAREVIRAVKEKLGELGSGLPEGVTIRPAYDRSNLILRAIHHLQRTLTEESIIVALVALVFLMHLRSALVVIISLPVGLLAAFLIMQAQGITANIMSLAGLAIAIGAMVDAGMVMVENAHKHLERLRSPQENRWAVVQQAAQEVGPSLFWSLLIITVSFLPVFALEAQEGRLFRPLAYTKTWAMAAAAVSAITVVPVLMGYLVRGRIRAESANPLSRWIHALYRPVVNFALRFRWGVLAAAALVIGVTFIPLNRLGSEFMPPLREGDLLYMPTTDPGISITKAREVLQETGTILKTFPEVAHVFGKAGRAETATDPAPLSMLETVIALKPKSEWRPDMTEERLIEEMHAAVSIPGVTNAWTMPIRARIDMLSTGIRTPVGVRIQGPDLAVLEDLAAQVAAVLDGVPGTASAYAEKSVGGQFVNVDIHRVEAARYGLSIDDVQEAIMTAIGGANVTWTVEGQHRYPVSLRYSRELRDNITALERVLVATPSGAQIPLSYVADLTLEPGPAVIKSENARATSWVHVDVRDTDIGSYVPRARAAVEAAVTLPSGYSISWGGQYAFLQRAGERLRLLIPLTLFIIVVLLYFNFRSITTSMIVLLSIPFALVGGIWLLYALDYELSVAVAVGFIALAGLAAETGVIMILYLEQAWKHAPTPKNLHSIVMEGAVHRVRPKLMTVLAVVLGLLPILWGSGAGAQAMKRIAAPMVGGMVTSTLLTLVVIPALYYIWRSRQLRKEQVDA